MNMREKIANAINPQAFSPGSKRSGEAIAAWQTRAREAADRVLAAMCKPTEEMIEAGGASLRINDVRSSSYDRDALDAFEAMLAACDSGSRSQSRDADAARAGGRQSGDAESGASPNIYPKDGGGGVG